MQKFLDKIEKRNYSKRAMMITISFILLLIASTVTAVVTYTTGSSVSFTHIGIGHNNFLQVVDEATLIWFATLLLLWILLVIFYWITTVEWLYKLAKLHNLNPALWTLLGAFLNILAVFAITIIISQPKQLQATNKMKTQI